MSKPKALSAKQQRFVQEYLLDLNATAAYKRAGYKCTGEAATAAAQQILGNIRVQEAIQAALAERNKRTEFTADLIVQETWETYKEARAAEKYAAAAVLLGLLGRHTGAFPTKLEHSGPNGDAIPIIVEFARAAPRTVEPAATGTVRGSTAG